MPPNSHLNSGVHSIRWVGDQLRGQLGHVTDLSVRRADKCPIIDPHRTGTPPELDFTSPSSLYSNRALNNSLTLPCLTSLLFILTTLQGHHLPTAPISPDLNIQRRSITSPAVNAKQDPASVPRLDITAQLPLPVPSVSSDSHKDQGKQPGSASSSHHLISPPPSQNSARPQC